MSAPAAPAAAVGGGGCGVEWSGQSWGAGRGHGQRPAGQREQASQHLQSHTGGEKQKPLSAVTQGGSNTSEIVSQIMSAIQSDIVLCY